MAKTTILICDDEDGIRRYLQKLLTSQGYVVETFPGGAELLKRLADPRSGTADLLLQDVRMPDMDGIQVLQEVKRLHPALPVVIMTAFGTIDAAVDAIRLGAYDYVTKPFPKEKILGLLDHALEQDFLRRENTILKDRLGTTSDDASIVFQSPRFREVYDMTLQVAKSDATILVLGESGTGKELIAGTVHRHSTRRSRNFLSINCAALADSLLESQLFGHLRGAFTGAVSNQKGLLDEADGGTLFLDEVGDTSLSLQAKLLRVIQEGDFMPVGSTRSKTVDVRFIAATNKDLEKEVREGRFREDLYYRLNVIALQLPPLRERREDIEPLARHFLRNFARRQNRSPLDISPEALAILTAYSWPGNVRELENVLERAVILTRGTLVTPEALPVLKRQQPPAGHSALGQMVSLDILEQEHIQRVLAGTGYHKSRTAEILGISRKTLDRKIAEYGLDKVADQ